MSRDGSRSTLGMWSLPCTVAEHTAGQREVHREQNARVNASGRRSTNAVAARLACRHYKLLS